MIKSGGFCFGPLTARSQHLCIDMQNLFAEPVVGGTVVSALGSTIASGAHGFPEQDAKRKALNDFIRSTDVFDGVVDFDAATLDPSTGGIKPEFVPESTMGGTGDRLHPNRAGYLAMGMSIDLALVAPSLAGR